MTDDYWLRLIRETVAEFEREVDKNLHTIYDEMFPKLLELTPVEERAQFFAKLDWGSLDPILWAKYTEQALTIAEAEQRKVDESIRPQMPQPMPVFGLGAAAQETAGLNVPLPLGRFNG